MSDPRWMRQSGRFGYWVPGNGEIAWIEKATIHGANDEIVERAIADAEAAVHDADLLRQARQLTDAQALGDAMEGQRLCRLGYHAWVPWLAVHYPPDVRGGAITFYTTWCARAGCDHTEQWDMP